jgi:hypothetical protein
VAILNVNGKPDFMVIGPAFMGLEVIQVDHTVLFYLRILKSLGCFTRLYLRIQSVFCNYNVVISEGYSDEEDIHLLVIIPRKMLCFQEKCTNFQEVMQI